MEIEKGEFFTEESSSRSENAIMEKHKNLLNENRRILEDRRNTGKNFSMNSNTQ